MTAAALNVDTMQQSQHPSVQDSTTSTTDMRVSAIPLTPVRTRDRDAQRSNGYRQQGPTPGRSAKTVPRFEDIMKERPDPAAMDHLSLPEDHLEDILSWVVSFVMAYASLC